MKTKNCCSGFLIISVQYNKVKVTIYKKSFTSVIVNLLQTTVQ